MPQKYKTKNCPSYSDGFKDALECLYLRYVPNEHFSQSEEDFRIVFKDAVKQAIEEIKDED